MKQFFLFTVVFLNSMVLFGQEVYFDTIQSVKGKAVFRVFVEKKGGYDFVLNFTNVSKKSIYVVPSNEHNSFIFENDPISFGKEMNDLEDIRYFKLIEIKQGETFPVVFSSSAVKFEFRISVILKGKIERREGGCYFRNPEYFHKKQTFVYLSNRSNK